jgi:tetratricopeptide (TPR) repeat protein
VISILSSVCYASPEEINDMVENFQSAFVSTRSKRYDEALSSLEFLNTDNYTSFSEAYFLRASIYNVQKEFNLAINDYSAVIRYNAHRFYQPFHETLFMLFNIFIESYYNRGYLYYQQGIYADCIEDMKNFSNYLLKFFSFLFILHKQRKKNKRRISIPLKPH